jgi:hypothetical protein
MGFQQFYAKEMKLAVLVVKERRGWFAFVWFGGAVFSFLPFKQQALIVNTFKQSSWAYLMIKREQRDGFTVG